MARRKRKRRVVHIVPDIVISLILTTVLTVAINASPPPSRMDAAQARVPAVSTVSPAQARPTATPRPPFSTHPKASPKPTATPRPRSTSTPTPRPKATPEPDVAYIGNRRSGIFHKPSCASVRQMNSSNKVSLYDRSSAIDQGYRPCQRCDP